MSDCLTRGFRAQLTTTLDSVLRKAVFEVMNIFEDTLHDQRMDVAHKGEEIAQLKIKLQKAELKLKDYECGGVRGAETNKTQMTPTGKGPEVVTDAAGPTAEVPEIDFEVPDDWCAPLGCETASKQDEGVCPSVRLRPLSISLWHIPILKHEMVNRNIDFHQKTKGSRKSRRISALNDRHKQLPVRDLRTRRASTRKDMKLLLRDIKQEYSNLSGLRRSGRHLSGKEQEDTATSKREQRKSATTESRSTEQEAVENGSKKTYSCKYCSKAFASEFGQRVHARSHKCCRGCKKVFPIKTELMSHKKSCKKLKLKTKKASNYPKTSSDEEKTPTPSKKQGVCKKSSSLACSEHSESSGQRDEASERYPCTYCNRKYFFRYLLEQHMRIHTGEKPFSCSTCQKKFRLKATLKAHVLRLHKKQTNSSATNRDLAWTKPLEEVDDKKEDLNSSSKGTNPNINYNKVKRRCPSITMGVGVQQGFACAVCQQVVTTKRILIEHFRIHTGEKPIKCERCHAKFRTKSQLCMHRKRCRYPVEEIQCDE